MYVYTVCANLKPTKARKCHQSPEVTDSCEPLWRGLELSSGSVEDYSVSWPLGLLYSTPQFPDPWTISTATPLPSPQTPFFFFLIVLVFKTVSLTETWGSLIKLNWLASKTQGSFSLCLLKCWDYQHTPPCWVFYVGCREETDSHAYTANTS